MTRRPFAPYGWIARPSSMLLIVVSLFLVLCGLTAYLANDNYRRTKAHALNSDRVTAGLLSDLVFEHEQGSLWVLRAYANRPVLKDAMRRKNLAEALPYLIQLKEENDEIDAPFITDEKGVLWANYPVDKSGFGTDLSSRDWYRGVSYQWKPYVSGVFKKIVHQKELAVALCVPVFGEGQRVLGVLACSQRAAFLGNIIERVPRNIYEHATLIDRDGNIVYSTRSPELDKPVTYRFASLVGDAVHTGAATIEARGGDAESHYLSVATVQNIGWRVVVDRSHRNLVRSTYPYAFIIAVIALAFFAAGFLFLLYVKKKFLLSETMDKLAMERELREKEEKFAEIFQHMSSGVAIYEAVRRGEDFLFKDFNAAAEGIEAVTKEEILGRSVIEVFPGIKEIGLLDVLKRVYKTGNPERLPAAFYHDGRIQGWRANFVFRLSTGDVVAVYDDETERKKFEEEILSLNLGLEERVKERTAQLEAANNELEAFSYSVSHDLRAPLTHISGYADLLVRRFHEALPEKGRHYVEVIADSVRQMGILIDDLLSFSRTGRQEMRQVDLDMKVLLREAVELVQPEIEGRSIEWSIAALPTVHGDRTLLRTVWVNLLSNAVKFTRGREKARIEIGFREEDEEYVFFMRDNGVGFDMRYVHKLFGVFQRLHSSQEFEGTGIGLANVRRIILKHGGRAWAEGEPDKGAAVYFTLPRKKEGL